jgi:hypothetical protein
MSRIEVEPKGAALVFLDNIFGNPEGLIAYIGTHPEGAQLRTDMKVFSTTWRSCVSGRRRDGEFAHAGLDRGHRRKKGMKINSPRAVGRGGLAP